MILVTGASGLVGKAISARFAQSYSVIGTSFSNKEKELISLNLTDEIKVKEFFQKYAIEGVIHCAAIIPSRSGALPDVFKYFKNVQMVCNILSNITDKIRFVNISTTALYRSCKRVESCEDSDILCTTPYLLSKSHVEEILHLFYSRTENLLNIRIASPYSVGMESDTVLYKFIRSALEKNVINVWGSGRRSQAFTNVDSLAVVLESLFPKTVSGSFNYVTTKSISMADLAKKIKGVKRDVIILRHKCNDPEEDSRTMISVEKISRLVKIEDSIDEDIADILSRHLK